MYDCLIVGAGWAGINAALTLEKLGLKIALIEKDKLGGVCLNYGCISTKTYFQSAKLIYQIKKAKQFGIDVKEFSIKFPDIFNRKEKIVKDITAGLCFKLKEINLFYSTAQIKSPAEIVIDGKILKTKNLILATGSRPKELTNLKFDGKKILSSTDILNLKILPKNLLIIGAGSIGCEFAWALSNFGVDITLIEKEPNILPGIDIEISKKLEVEFKKLGIKVMVSCDFNKINIKNFEKVLVSIGRSPNLDQELVNLTKDPHVYLAGDVNGKLFLAACAAKEGKIAAINIYNSLNSLKKETINYNLIPNSIFVHPEIATVGIDCEEKAKRANLNYKTKTFSLKANGFCNILGETGGLIKLFLENKTNKILGGIIFSPQASELINILVTAINSSLTLDSFKKLSFIHPSISESLSEIE